MVAAANRLIVSAVPLGGVSAPLWNVHCQTVGGEQVLRAVNHAEGAFGDDQGFRRVWPAPG
jgi:hypothetical protein